MRSTRVYLGDIGAPDSRLILGSMRRALPGVSGGRWVEYGVGGFNNRNGALVSDDFYGPWWCGLLAGFLGLTLTLFLIFYIFFLKTVKTEKLIAHFT